VRRAWILAAVLLAAAAARAETLTLTLSDAIDRALAEGTAGKIAALSVDESRLEAARGSVREAVTGLDGARHGAAAAGPPRERET